MDKIDKIPNEMWEKAAKRYNTSVESLKAEWAKYIAERPVMQPNLITANTQPPRVNNEGCTTTTIDLAPLEMFGIKIEVTFCRNGDNWRAALNVCLFFFGNRKCFEGEISPERAEMGFDVDFLFASVHLVVGIKGPNHCLYTRGSISDPTGLITISLHRDDLICFG